MLLLCRKVVRLFFRGRVAHYFVVGHFYVFPFGWEKVRNVVPVLHPIPPLELLRVVFSNMERLPFRVETKGAARAEQARFHIEASFLLQSRDVNGVSCTTDRVTLFISQHV